MIGPTLRDGMDTVAIIEATRYGIWATLTAYKQGAMAYEFLRRWSAVQAAMRGLLADPLSAPDLYRHALNDALPAALASADLACEFLCGAEPSRREAYMQKFRMLGNLATEAASAPNPKPAPLPEGTPPPKRKRTRNAS